MAHLEAMEPRLLLRAPIEAPPLGAPPPPGPDVVWVGNATELQNAVRDLRSGQTVVVRKGTYNLGSTLYVGLNSQVSNVTIRGETEDYRDVTLLGRGMENAQYGSVPHGISVYNAQDVTIANMSIGQVYFHPVDMQGSAGAERVRVYHTRLFDAGQQFIKANPGNGGVDDSIIEYNLVEYTVAPPTTDHGGGTGYTNGISAHQADRWSIRHNTFRNFHTPDNAGNLWNPAVLMWSNSTNTVVEGNTFIDTDRAIAFGLYDNTGYDHSGGVIRNNFVYMRPGLFSASRRAASDAQILVYDSPNTKVYHNTVLTSGNTARSIETRWQRPGVEIRNNLADAPIGARDGATYASSGNYLSATSGMFVNAAAGDLHLVSNAATQANVLDKVAAASGVTTDWDGTTRPTGTLADIGADELTAPSDTTAPTVSSRSPVAGAINIAVGTDVTATFSEAVQSSSVGFSLAGPSGSVSAAFSYDSASRTATLNPSSDLAASTTYTAQLSGVRDLAGNLMPTVSWTFTTAAAAPTDTTAPTVSSRSPVAGAINIAVGTNVTATFNEAVQSSSVGFSLLAPGGSAVSAAFSYDSASRTATLNPSADLAASTTYTARLSGVRDLAGNLMPTATWTFTTAAAAPTDTTAPTVTARSPGSGATGVAAGTNVTATFSEAVQSSSVGFSLLAPGGSAVSAAFSYDSASRTATLNPYADLAASTTYTAQLTGVRDLAGNLMAATSWSFTTAAPPSTVTDATLWDASARPAVVSENDGNAVELGVKFQASVDGVVKGVRFYKGATNTGTHLGRLWTSTGTLLAQATFTGESASGWQQVNFATPVAISANTTYVVSYYAPRGYYSADLNYFSSTGVTRGPLSAASSSQAGGNGVYRYGTGGGFPNSTYFGTNYWVDVVFSSQGTSPPADTTAPTVTARSPGSGATGVSAGTNVTATFSEAVQSSSVGFSLAGPSGSVSAAFSYDSASRTATLNPSSDLAASTTYTAQLTGVRDLAGNLMPTVSWTFTTAAAAPSDTTAPTVSSRSPVAGAINIAVGTNVTATFSEAVQSSSVGFSLLAPGGSAVSAAVSYDSASRTATLNPSADLAASTTYTAQLSGVRDLAGNLMPTATWTFTTAAAAPTDTTAPTVTARSPGSGATGVSAGTNVTATFSEAVQSSSVGFSLTGPSGSVSATVSYDSASRTATLNPYSDLAASTTYTAQLSGVRDLAGNLMAATSWSFTTAAAASMPGDVIHTHHDDIPNFGANPTITSVRTGDWADPSTWSAGRVPAAGDVVSIQPSTTVTYGSVSDAALQTVAIQAGARLQFRTDVNTRLVAANILVLEAGELRIGTQAAPVDPQFQAELIIADQRIDTTRDPSQYGTGLIGLGTVTIHGAALPATFIRLAAEPRAGATTLVLEQAAVGWKPGDTLYLPDSRQLAWNEKDSNYVPQWEYPKIASISADGKTLTLTAALRFNHLGARDGNNLVSFLPHVANQTRNVTIRSANPSGTRGHTMFADRAIVDIRYAAFEELGRTKMGADDNTTYDASGKVTRIGTNQVGRYPVHLHHLIGPVSRPANGYQFSFVGNTVTSTLDAMPFRWGLTLHDSHYGLVQDNVVSNWGGAGIVTEDGSESHNVIARNFVSRIDGTGERVDEAGTAGVGFWLRGPNNYVRDNVATNIQGGVYSYGFNVFARYLGSARIPAFQGADKMMAGESITVDMNATPLREFARNEVYGATPNGMTVWWLGAFATEPRGNAGTIKDFRAWHFDQWGFFGYETNNLTIDGYVARNNFSINDGAKGMVFSDYLQKGLKITNANIQGSVTGINLSSASDGITLIENSYLRSSYGVVIPTNQSVNGGGWLPAKSTVIRNVRFDAPPGRTTTAVALDYSEQYGSNLVQKDEVFVYDFNGVTTDDFRVFYNEQRADFIVPRTGNGWIGSPESGLTNQQNWSKYGIAIAGAVAPSNAVTRSGIQGLVTSIAQASSSARTDAVVIGRDAAPAVEAAGPVMLAGEAAALTVATPVGREDGDDIETNRAVPVVVLDDFEVLYEDEALIPGLNRRRRF